VHEEASSIFGAREIDSHYIHSCDARAALALMGAAARVHGAAAAEKRSRTRAANHLVQLATGNDLAGLVGSRRTVE
jgi:hypothetical protein